MKKLLRLENISLEHVSQLFFDEKFKPGSKGKAEEVLQRYLKMRVHFKITLEAILSLQSFYVNMKFLRLNFFISSKM